MMRRLLGPHLGGQWTDKLEILRKWQPPLILVLQPEVDKVRQLREACPGAIIVGRFFHDDSHYASNINARPVEFAREIHQEIANNPVTPLLDYVQSNNETNQDWEGIQKLNQFTFEWMNYADLSGAYKCAILAFSVGNPDLPNKPGDPAGFDGKMLYWQQVLESLRYAQKHSHILLLHAYGYPDMFHPDANWYIYRYERQVQASLKTLGITSLKYAYGEIGIDRLIVDGKGGYRIITNDQDYINQLLQWERDLQGQGLLLGGAIFTFGDSGGWDTYDISSTNAASLIATHYVDHTGEYDTPGGSPAEKETIFLPIVGTGETAVSQRNIDPRATERKVRIEIPPVADGKEYWFVYEIKYYNEQEADQLGPDHHLMIDVRDENGQRVVGKDVMVAWSTDQAPQKTEAKTGEEYATGFGMSPGRNAYSGWVSDGLPSEKVVGVGMGEETPSGWNAGIHTTTGVKWRKEIMKAAQPPPIKPPPASVPTLTHPVQDSAKRVVSQRFGENPQDYARFGLAGHPGLDFAVPQGTPIVAADDGEVMESLIDADGYGEYVKLKHAWGESLYAHLSKRNLLTGRIGKGGLIGLSGNTGNSTGPHLHLGMRINPYTRGAPYDGYSDPESYLKTMQPEVPTPELLRLIKLAATEFGIEWQLLASQAWAESSFNPKAQSSAGAKGLMQIMDATWAEWSPKVLGGNDPFNPKQNLRVGAAYLKWLIGAAGNKTFDALVAYGWGIGNVLSDTPFPAIWTEYANKIIHGRDLLKAIGA